MQHRVQWTAPAPLWKSEPDLTETGRVGLRRPAILRFASDRFMEEFNRTLETDPSKLAGLEARYETWRGPGGSTPAVPEVVRSSTQLERKLARMKVAAERRVALFGEVAGVGVLNPPAPTATTTTGGDPNVVEKTLKLYQPAHQRFYLVTAALVCRQPGLPDRTVDADRQEKTSFVLRRLRTITDATGVTRRQEYGFVISASGGAWVRIQSPDLSLTPGEDTLPLFFVNFQDDAGHKRRVLSGLIPVGRRELYVGAPEQAAPAPAAIDQGAGDGAEPGAPPPPLDPRIALLSADVIEPWKALVQRAAKAKELIDNPGRDQDGKPLDEPTKAAMRLDPRQNIQVGSWYVLLDFVTFLEQQLKPVWEAITTGTTPPGQADRAVVSAIAGASLPPALITALTGASPGRSVKATLKDALAAIAAFRDPLERAAGDFMFATPVGAGSDYPDFLFPLADPVFGGPLPDVAVPGAGLTAMQIILRKISGLRNLIAAALPTTPTWPVPELPIAAQPVMAPDETAQFVIRCVFERPECGPIDPPLLSAPSREFELAAFFDPDAPARPIRISLPVDTSPAGLRRAPKNTAFIVSDMLCGQINRAKGLGLVDLVLSVLPWPFHKDLPNAAAAPCKTDTGASLGMICSLSIPIITICALILLIIIVIVLDIIFRWLPWLIVCFPLPKFSAKPPHLAGS